MLYFSYLAKGVEDGHPVTGANWGERYFDHFDDDIKRHFYIFLSITCFIICVFAFLTQYYIVAVIAGILGAHYKNKSWIHDHYLDAIGSRPVVLPRYK
jgi:hypothetical protein